ncbi:Sporulation related domain-containing protein [Tropicimonas isoalkanivorans]|uniref:Sporulation related domain-containing protein n=2 Tax=Tropicimonas isoalkanivorans TaxID=441112 RepID=A0A1I1FX58_9RHOB|nr:Sporulation related domain-containing protein [Tropicimonas isoalkanivorans]
MPGGGDKPESEATAFAERPAAGRLVERDVEAPEVFQVSDTGLWDGRPSLGGVWVAHPDVKEPERVVIRNEESGSFVIGALFKREREHPGPKLQVSSDAAAALGLLAGKPTKINVTALRREEPQAKSEAAAPAIEEPAVTEAVVADIPAPAAAPEPAAVPAQEQVAFGAPIAAGTIGGGDGAPAAPAEVSAPADPATIQTATKQKRSWNPFRRFKRNETVTPVAAPAPTPGIGYEPLTSEPLPAVASEAAAAPEAIAESQANEPKIDKPYVQLGIFSVEQNANNTADAMRKNGVTAKVFEQESSGKTFWRVVVGPASSRADRTSMLKKVKDLGFADAYPVSG